MRALISGNKGFIGRNFTRKLRADGWDVDGFNITAADARDWFPTHHDRYDLLIHAAAVVGGRENIDGDPLAIAGNMGIDHAAMSWALRTGTPMLYFSSAAAYPVALQANRGHALTEDDLQFRGKVGMPDNTYGWSKVTGERMAIAARAKGAHISIVRPFSGYGEDQDLDYPWPMYVDRARRRADPFHVWGDGTQTRDFIHIDDVFAASMAVVASGTEDPVNLCTGVPTSMFQLAQAVCEVAGYSPEIQCLLDKPQGTRYRVGDPTRMRRYHEPRVTLLDGIRRALA